MRTVSDIYAAYRIMPNLQMHQLRVAAVARTICKAISVPVDEESVTLATLFHDMGNIIKFNLPLFPEFVEPQGLDYWQGVRQEYIDKYGLKQHVANHAIAVELKLSKKVVALIDGIDFSAVEHTRDQGFFEQKICEYSDLRVAPFGITSMQGRIDDIEVRYRKNVARTWEEDRTVALTAAAKEIERQIFKHCSIKPEDITDESSAPLIPELQNYPVA